MDQEVSWPQSIEAIDADNHPHIIVLKAPLSLPTPSIARWCHDA
jgi:hypothetical protein